MNKVLILAYYFPPAGGGGVQRATKFVKYLPEFGWQPFVLTVAEKYHSLQDESLIADIPANVTVRATSAWMLSSRLPWRLRRFISRWALIVDEQIGWYPPALQAGLQMIKQHHPQVIYTTSTPYTSHLVGKKLKYHSRLPWVADFRDPWIGNFTIQPPTPLHASIIHHLEATIVHQADQIVVVSEPMRQALLTRYSNLPATKFITITNGYDPQDINPSRLNQAPQERFLITYSGTFYSSQRSPSVFLKGVKLVIEEGSIPKNKLAIRFVGNTGLVLKQEVDKYALGDVVEITGYVSHHQSIQYLQDASLLLLVIGSGPGSQAVMTGKIYEYLAIGRPILALVPEGAAKELLQTTQAGLCVDPQDARAVAEALRLAYQKWEKGQLSVTPNQDILARYDRRYLTGQLAELFEKVSRQAS